MPVNKIVRVQVTGADVIHSFIVQSLGIRIDAVPGRLNETWFKAEREGIYYGQCSKLCGKDHAYMPIAVRVVSQHALRGLAAGREEEVRQHRRRAASPSPADVRTPPPVDRADDHAGARGLAMAERRIRRTRPTTPSARLAPLHVFDEPQGHRHALPDLRDHRRLHRRRDVDLDPHAAA